MLLLLLLMMMITEDSARTRLYASEERKDKIRVHGLFLLTALPFLMCVMVIPKWDTSSYIDLLSLIVPT